MRRPTDRHNYPAALMVLAAYILIIWIVYQAATHQ
jgi:hypothetical protein